MSRPRKPKLVPGDGDERHGTVNGYANCKCRCVDCTEAWRVYYKLTRQAEKPELAADDPRHGTSTAYRWWHCRCEACRAAHSAETSAHKRAQRRGVR